jgi:hypothetical protein
MWEHTKEKKGKKKKDFAQFGTLPQRRRALHSNQ